MNKRQKWMVDAIRWADTKGLTGESRDKMLFTEGYRAGRSDARDLILNGPLAKAMEEEERSDVHSEGR